VLEEHPVGLEGFDEDPGELGVDDALLERVVHVHDRSVEPKNRQALRYRTAVVLVAHVAVAAHEHGHPPLHRRCLAVLDGQVHPLAAHHLLEQIGRKLIRHPVVYLRRHDELLVVLGLQAEHHLVARIQHADAIGGEHCTDDVDQRRLAGVGVTDDEGYHVEAVVLPDIVEKPTDERQQVGVKCIRLQLVQQYLVQQRGVINYCFSTVFYLAAITRL